MIVESGYILVGCAHREELEPGKILVLLKRRKAYLTSPISEIDLAPMINKGIIVDVDGAFSTPFIKIGGFSL